MPLRKYLPFEKCTLVSDLALAEIVKRLQENIQPERKIFWGNKNISNKAFEGFVTGNHFTIKRIISYRNSFLPVIKGDIVSMVDGTNIKINMRPHISVIIFMCFWLGIVGSVCIGIIIAAILQFTAILKHGFSPTILIPFGLLLFGYCILTIPFKMESGTAKKFLKLLFKAREKKQIINDHND